VLRSLGRAVVVCIGLFVLLLAAQRGTQRVAELLSRQGTALRLDAQGQTAAGNAVGWTASLTEEGILDIDGRPVRSIDPVLDRIRAVKPGGMLAIAATSYRDEDTGADRNWVFELETDGDMTLGGKPATLDDFAARVKRYGLVADEKPTRPVTVQDVMDAYARGEVCIPQRPKVSFPGRLTYEQAHPEATDESDYVIREFHEAPSIRDRAVREELKVERYLTFGKPDDWDHLPPVEERLPLNPLVAEGPDGVGRYGRTKETATWTRCTTMDWSIYRKIGYPTFMRFGPTGTLQPHYAYKWTAEDNNRVYTLWLRKGHKWSDGYPWSANDVAWVCNTVIGSPYWGGAPNWMQETDGSILLYPDDILDWKGLASAILKQADAPEPSPGRQVMTAVADEMPSALRLLAASGKLGAAKVDGVVRDLRRMESEGVTLNEVTAEALKAALAAHDLSSGELGEVHKTLGELKLVRLKPLLADVAAGTVPDDLTQAKIVNLFNKLFQVETFYDKAAWTGADLTSEFDALMAKGPSRLTKEETQRLEFLTIRRDLLRRVDDDPEGRPTGDIDMKKEPALLKKMNLLLFRAAYAGLVAKAVKERVKVEAVADPDDPNEDPNARHIIRFTFRKPMSFFLEKTATFMYYRGLFSIARHEFGEYHPAGPDDSGRLAAFDILEWDDFLKTVAEQGKAAAASPGKQLWSLMSDQTRGKVEAGMPGRKEDDHEAKVAALKEAVIAEINRVLTSREFFTEEAWKSVGLDADLNGLQDEGYTKQVDARNKRRYMELLVREDLRRRGVAALGDAEVFRLNEMMFRAAFSGEAGLVATNRENGLDIQAHRHPGKYDNWVLLLQAQGAKFRAKGHRPTLCPWRIVTDPDENTTSAIRNPYYFMVDTRGNQLPYLDVMETVKQSEKSVRMNKLLSRGGGVNFQCRDLVFEDFTVLKQNEEAGDYKVYLWANDYCGELTFYFPQTHKDPEYARLQADPRFRHAMSYALNRQEIIDVVYRGMGKPAQWSTPEGSPYYNEKHATMAVEYDPRKANAILDSMGLDKRAADGTRLFWGGRPVIMDVNTVPERPLAAIQMACNYWKDVGINAQLKVRQGNLINQMLSIGILDIGVHKEGGNYFGPILAGGYAPTHSAECGWGQKWVQWLRSGGQSGWEPPERVKELDVMWSKVVQAPDQKTKMAAWQELADYAADQLRSIGVMTPPGQPVYVRNNFRNVNKISLAGWMAHEPGNNCPEVFYIEED